MAEKLRFKPQENFVGPIREIAETLEGSPMRSQILRHLERLSFSFACVPVAGEGDRLLDVGSKTALLPLFRSLLGYENISACAYLPNEEPFASDETFGDMSYRLYHFDLEHSAAAIEPASVDVVTLFEVIEHMTIDPMFAMANINRALKPGGILVMSTVNCASLMSIKKALAGLNPYIYPPFTIRRSPNRHNREYSAKELIRLARKSGFKVRRVESKFFFSEEDAELLQKLEGIGFPVKYPGDDTLLICEKISDEIVRAPNFLYNRGDDEQSFTAEEILAGRQIVPTRDHGVVPGKKLRQAG